MEKIVRIAAFLLVGLAVCLAIVNLVLNVLIFTKQEVSPHTTPAPATLHTAPPGTVSKEPGFKDAADFLLKGLDLSVDPCQDFYAFACNTFIKNNPPQTLSYGQTQKLINEAIAKKLNATSQTTSTAKEVLKKVFDTCRAANQKPGADKSNEIYQIMKNLTNGFPMLEKDWKEESLSNGKMWKAIATLELHYGLSTLLQSMVTVDYRNVSRNALYLDQLPLSMSRDYYVKPQFISELNLYRDNMIKAVKQFRTDIQSPASDETILSVIFYIYLFNYSFIGSQIFFSLSFEINELDSNVQKNADPRKNEYILEMPTYFGTLNTYLEGKVHSKRTFVNLLMLRFIADNTQYLGNGSDSYTELYQRIRESNGESSDWKTASEKCISLVEYLMPHATGKPSGADSADWPM
ncbi:unnamed protein product [Gongylonema pulchrum]|uniref:Peptidase_M13_N domain-containing protein n=1 Tax=Gongylonema pulchrum TaxID=637853 RepID=A0A183DZU8_9BILA|nr:unnamed protein product [Gongylonema pulchrum]